MKSLAARTYRDELIDGDAYTSDEYAECLRQIELINRLTNGYGPTIGAVEAFMSENPGHARPLRILDIGFGRGDTLRAISAWARGRGVSAELSGIDIQPLSADLAYRCAKPEDRIRYLTGDVFAHSPEQPYDIVLNALFMHHLDDTSIVRALQWMERHSRYGFFINDLHRHPLAYHFIAAVTRVFGFNRLIRHDAPLSVARGFTPGEWRAYAGAAGLRQENLRIRWHWAFRYGVRYVKSV